MASPKEERDRLRRERIAAESHRASSNRGRLMAGYAVAGVLGVAVLVGLVLALSGGGDDGQSLPDNARIQPASGVFTGVDPDGREGTTPPAIQFGDLADAAKQAGCELGLGLRDEGANHYTKLNQRDWGEYGTAPATSGDHYGVATEAGTGALADGAYLNQPVAGRTVHSLEHGRIEIQYSSKLPEPDQLALKGVFLEDSDAMIMFPNDDQPFAVAVAAWTNFVGCRSFDPLVIDVIRDFRDRFRGNGPESVPISL